MTRGPKRDREHLWRTPEAARSGLLGKAGRLAPAAVLNQVAFTHLGDNPSSRWSKAGKSMLSADMLFQGYPYVGRLGAITVSCDPLDGSLIELTMPTVFPAREGTTSPRISEVRAKQLLASSQASFRASVNWSIKLGWAVPPGRDRAVLAYYFEQRPLSSVGSEFCIDATSGNTSWVVDWSR